MIKTHRRRRLSSLNGRGTQADLHGGIPWTIAKFRRSGRNLWARLWSLCLSCVFVVAQDDAKVANDPEAPVGRPALKAMIAIVNGWMGDESIQFEMMRRLGFYREPLPLWLGPRMGPIAGFFRNKRLDEACEYLDGGEWRPRGAPHSYAKHLGAGQNSGFALLTSDAFGLGANDDDVARVFGMAPYSVRILREHSVSLTRDFGARDYEKGARWDGLVVGLKRHMMMIVGPCREYSEEGIWRNLSRVNAGSVAILAGDDISVPALGPAERTDALQAISKVVEGDAWLKAFSVGATDMLKHSRTGWEGSFQELLVEWSIFARVHLRLCREGQVGLFDDVMLCADTDELVVSEKKVKLDAGPVILSKTDLSVAPSDVGSLLACALKDCIVVLDMDREMVWRWIR